MRGRIPKPWKRASDGHWWVTLGGKQIKLAESKHAAYAELARLQASRIRSPALSGRISTGVLMELWGEHARQAVKPNTWTNYARYAKSFVAFAGTLEARDLKPWHITQWVGKNAWSGSTQHLAISIIKMAMAWAADQGLIEIDPIKRARRPRMARRKPIMLDDAAKVIERAAHNPRMHAALRLLLVTGMRPGELCSIDVEGIDLAARQCVVRGKRGVRTVYLGQEAVRLLEELCRGRMSGPLLIGCQGRRLGTGDLQWWFKRARRELGLGEHVTPHTFRGLFSTEALRRGVDSALVSKLLGHADPSVLMNHYAAPDSDMLMAAAEKASGK